MEEGTASLQSSLTVLDDGLSQPTSLERADSDTVELPLDEPRLKYQRLGGDVDSILAHCTATSLCVTDKLLTLGTSAGEVHIIDFNGNKISSFQDHKQRVNDLSIDADVEFLASCSEDGTVTVRSLYGEEVYHHQFRNAVKSIAIDPRYGQRKTNEFVCGGAAGQLLISSKGWLGARNTVIHTGEGPITIICWAGNLVAWANSLGVKVYDMWTHTRIAYFERPSESVGSEDSKCSLYWQSDKLLYSSWGTTVQVHRAVQSVTNSYTVVLTEMQTIIELQMQQPAMGVAPFGPDIVVLTEPPLERKPSYAAVTAEDPAIYAQPMPEIHLLTWRSEQLSVDSLPLPSSSDDVISISIQSDLKLYAHHPFEHPAMQAGVTTRDVVPGSFDEWWQDQGDEPMYWILSAKDVIVARARDTTDRINWLLDHQRYEAALKVATHDSSVKQAVVDKVAEAYLNYLLGQGQFEKAAALCPRLLKDNGSAWERWVYLFGQLRQLPVLAPYLPTSSPTLRATAYDMVLTAFLLSPTEHAKLLEMIHKWPPHIYSVTNLTDLVLQRMRSPGGDSLPLLHCAAALYQLQGRHDLALTIHLHLRDPAVFDFVAKHRLLAALGNHVAELMDIDEERAVELLVEQCEEVPPAAAVPEILSRISQSEKQGDKQGREVWRRRLHKYLDSLFVKDPTAASEYHSMQVDLYAEYQPDRLMSFLMSSQQYSLERALECCEAKGFVKEQVYILGRMGNSDKALRLIIDKLQNMPQAIEFVQEQGDDELWELLIQLTIGNANLTGSLLDHISGYVNPLRLVRQIPKGMAVENLRDRLVKIISDFQMQTSLREGCNTILKHDCITLQQRVYHEIQRAMRKMYLGYLTGPKGSSHMEWWSYDSTQGRTHHVQVEDLPGPLGAKQLHIRPKSVSGDRDPKLPKAWVGVCGRSAQMVSESAAGGPRSRGRAMKRGPAKQPSALARPPLPSLVEPPIARTTSTKS